MDCLIADTALENRSLAALSRWISTWAWFLTALTGVNTPELLILVK